MWVCGVVCEYNPFHKGHALHLARARAISGADYVVCIMSGAMTQRGQFARHDKWTRARMALLSGADLVLELPARFACAPAPEFARGAVQTLAGLGVLTHLSFGCEENAIPLLSAAAQALKAESPAFKAALREALDTGMPYPRARAIAAQAASGVGNLAEAIAAPNAALALEYLAALPEGVTPVPIAREGAGYQDMRLAEFSSATAVRAALEMGDLPGASTARMRWTPRCFTACAPWILMRFPGFPESTKAFSTASLPRPKPLSRAMNSFMRSKASATPTPASRASAQTYCWALQKNLPCSMLSPPTRACWASGARLRRCFPPSKKAAVCRL